MFSSVVLIEVTVVSILVLTFFPYLCECETEAAK